MNRFSFTSASAPVLAAALLLAGCAGAPGGGAGVLVSFPAKKPELRCDSNGVCSIKVYARIAPGGGCEVMPEYEDVRIGKHPQTGEPFKPKMRWKIDSIDPGHAYDYRFAFRPADTPPVYGIEIHGNNPTVDFDKPGHDVNGRGVRDVTTFKWDNKHGRPYLFHYDLNVERSPHNQDTWSACARVDPKMYND
jgi:hypothetical protein